MKIVVIGGTGLIGSKVVARLAQAGHDVLAAAPNTGVNTLTGEGLAEALVGCEVLVDLANSPSFDDQVAMDFFQKAAANLMPAEIAAGVRHHIALSVVGTDRLQESGYFRAKQVQETAIRESGIPFTIVHATQFMEFLRGIAQSAIVGDEVRLPHAWIQPMAADDVAAAVAAVALDKPAGGMVEIAGPEKFRLDEIVARVLAFDKDPHPVVRDPEARYYGIRLKDDALLPAAGARLGETAFDWWLANVPPPPKR
ncbi:SDR family oxidoreductase [Novosphingobium sp. YAF33]|uniref:SDR family oxidoreductase n=1 Tax=Novosphingobium sp. YAF33 TaxID=3233082 RepID=UPI003F9B6B42